jgi:SAM-dependent methyltransferase
MINLEPVRDHYESALEAGGDDGQIVGWRNRQAQLQRFMVISDVLRGLPFRSVSDFGCGSGEFLTYLRTAGWSGDYFGVDLSPKMIDVARSRFATDNRAYFEAGTRSSPADVTVASGVFNVSLDESQNTWLRYCREILREMWLLSSLAVVFNMLSLDSDLVRRKNGLAYFDPTEWLEFCRAELSSHLRLDQTYGQYDFTIAVFKMPLDASPFVGAGMQESLDP